MTQEQAQKKTQKKIEDIKKFIKKKNVTITARQIVNKQGIVENAVFYYDNEKYDVQ